MTANFFSNQDPDLPNLKLKLPKIRQSLPKIQMTGDADFLFEVDGKTVEINNRDKSANDGGLNFHS